MQVSSERLTGHARHALKPLNSSRYLAAAFCATTLLLARCNWLLAPASAQQNDSKNVELARNIVKVYGQAAAGSGVAVYYQQGRTILLTAAHVIDGTTLQEDPYVVDAYGKKMKIISIKVFPPLDLAELQVEGRINVADISDHEHQGGWVKAIGFAQAKTVPSIRHGWSEAQATDPQARPGGYGILYSAQTETGMSGGGLFDDKNQLIGIHGQADTLKTSSGSNYKLGTSLAVPITFWPNYQKFKPSNNAANTKQALSVLSPANRGDSENLETQASFNLTTGRLVVAETQISELIERQPNDGTLFAKRGLIRLESKKYADAIQDFSTAISRGLTSYKIYLNRGNAYYLMGQPKEAVEDYSRALKLNEKLTVALKSRAQAYARMQRFEDAKIDLAAALAIEPRNGAILMEMATLARLQGDVHQAIEHANRAIELLPDQAQPLALRGALYSLMKENNKSLRDFNNAIDMNSDWPDLFNMRGHIYSKLGRLNEALRDFEQSLQLEPGRPEAVANIGETLFLLGDKIQGCRNYHYASSLGFHWNSEDWSPTYLKECQGKIKTKTMSRLKPISKSK